MMINHPIWSFPNNFWTPWCHGWPPASSTPNYFKVIYHLIIKPSIRMHTFQNPSVLYWPNYICTILSNQPFQGDFQWPMVASALCLGYRTDQALHVAPKRIAAARTCNSDKAASSFRIRLRTELGRWSADVCWSNHLWLPKFNCCLIGAYLGIWLQLETHLRTPFFCEHEKEARLFMVYLCLHSACISVFPSCLVHLAAE